MALLLADALLRCKGFDIEEQLENYLKWHKEYTTDCTYNLFIDKKDTHSDDNYEKIASHLHRYFKPSGGFTAKACDSREYLLIQAIDIIIGAVSSCLEFEDVRANRDLVNNANRLTNMDTANMKKMLETGLRQIKEIELIDKKLGIKNIPNEKAKLLCNLRKENESASLADLATLMSEALDKPITKSNINHLFRYLHELYERLNNDD